MFEWKRRTIVFGLALVIAVTVGLTIRVCETDTNQSQSATSSISTATSTPVVLVGSAADSVSPTPQPEVQVTLLGLCRGEYGTVSYEYCLEQFDRDGGRLGLGEPVTIIMDVGGATNEFEFSLDGTNDPRLGHIIDMAITEFAPGTVHTVQIRYRGGPWSDPLEFMVDLLDPLAPIVSSICAEGGCAPVTVLPTAGISNTEDAFYPLVEDVVGVARGGMWEWMDQSYIWVEFMLNSDAGYIGCSNCDAAQAAGVTYPDRLPFGESGIFYNWDLRDLDSGKHDMQARLRNSKYIGPWSAVFEFVVE